MSIQESLLYAFEKQFASAKALNEVFIADRSPVDLASYLIADVQRGTFKGQPEVSEMVVDYVQRCIRVTNFWFSTVVLIQPGIALVEAEGKAPADPAYVEHINLIQAGLLLDERLLCGHYLIPRRITHIQDRLSALKNAATHCFDKCKEHRNWRESSGFLDH